MDDKKKFEIEFDDDFDAWLAQHDAQRKKEEEKRTRDIPVKRDVPVAKPSVSTEPAKRKPVRPSGAVSGSAPVKKSVKAESDVYISSKSTGRKPAETLADIPVSRKETVKNFKIHIDEEEFNAPSYEEPKKTQEQKNSDKAIYFAARQPSKAQIAHRRAQEAERQERTRLEKQQRAQQRKKQSKQVAHLSRMLTAIIIVLASVLLSMYGVSCINDILALNRSTELVEVSIEKDADYKEIIDSLGDVGLVKHEWFCKLLTKFRHFDEKTYINGIYYLTANMGVEGMLNEMREDQTSDETIRLSFPEGWTIPQIIKKLDENNVCPAEYLYSALESVEFDYAFVSGIPSDGGRCFNLEGYLFPDTYDFFISEKQNGIGENPNSVIRKFLSNYETKWNEVYAKRAQELGLTMDEVIIIASIIQKEAADKSQMADVSSVIHNRLNNRSSYPTLGCDSTKNYVNTYLKDALGDSKASVYLNGYDTNSTRLGLPVGPICNPGVSAIEAALNPNDTNYYYFCHNKKGKIYLASTYNQFQANWAQVLKDNKG